MVEAKKAGGRKKGRKINAAYFTLECCWSILAHLTPQLSRLLSCLLQLAENF